MAVLYRGKDVRVTITTEATGTSVITESGSIRTSTSSTEATGSALIWIPTLNDTRSDDYNSALRQLNIETLEINNEPTRESFDLIGRVTMEYPKVRDAFEVTITRKMDNPYFSQLFDKADHGVEDASTDTDSWRPSTDQRAATDGFRLHIWVATNSVYSFRNAAFRDHKVAPSPNKITVETLVFSGNLWAVSSSANTASTSGTEL
jgi:hypothetical protein